MASRQLPFHCSSLEQRLPSKRTLSSLFLHAGDSRLGEEMGVTPKEAARIKQEFLESMPGVGAFLEKVVEDCRQTGKGNAAA